MTIPVHDKERFPKRRVEIRIRETRNGALAVECGHCSDNPHISNATNYYQAMRERTLHALERHGVFPDDSWPPGSH